MALLQAELTDPDYGLTITDAKGHTMKIDIPVESGGHGQGFRPMQTMLSALCGCSAVDVVSILKKQRQKIDGLTIKVDGEREHGVEPSLWKTIHVFFELKGALIRQKLRVPWNCLSVNIVQSQKLYDGLAR